MKSLPKEYQLLKDLNKEIDMYFETAVKRDQYRLTDIYDYIKKKEPFSSQFPEEKFFSQFMRRMHDRGILKQFIKSCSVDTAIYHHYKWFFYPKV